jgi:hypothetical protein
VNRSQLIAVVCTLVASLVSPRGARGEDDSPGHPPAEERRSGRPWWRTALAAPDLALEGLAWPIKESVIWAERERLPERIRRALYFNEEETAGWRPSFELGGEIGPAAGVQLFHTDLWGGGEEIRLTTLFGFDAFSGPGLEEQQVGLLFLVPADRRPFRFRSEIFAGEDRDEDFYVREAADGRLLVGHEAGEHDDTTYELDVARARIQLDWLPVEDVAIGVAFRPLAGDVEIGDGGEPPIPERVDGFGGTTVLLGGGPVVVWDRRDDPARPRSGSRVRVEGGYWTGVEGRTTAGREYEYGRYAVELEQHLPTFRHDRTIALQATLDRVETRSGRAAPFWELPLADEDHLLRAYTRNRFRDAGAIVVNAEYRYPIRDAWDAFLFVDEGQVFGDYDDLDWDRFEWSAGSGVRFYSKRGLLFRVLVAFGEEQANFRFGLAQEF